MTIGQRIKEMRLAKNLTQDELAARIHTTKQTIHKYENGIITNIPSNKVEAIANALNTTPDYLMGWKEKEAPEPDKYDHSAKVGKMVMLNENSIKNLYRQIAKIGRQYGAAKVVLYGSRARGDNRQRSDIDLAVYGIEDRAQQALFAQAIEDLPTLLDFDLVFVRRDTDPKLLQNIEKDGVSLMSKYEEKRDKFKDAVQRLEEAIADYDKLPNSTMRDGVIQRFEFCTELAWKTCREYLLEQGYTEVNSPKPVMRQAFADGLVDNDLVWVEILNARNLTTHLYDDAEATKIFEDIKDNYLHQFQALAGKLE